MPASLQDRHIHSVAMESFNNHEMDFMPLLPTKTSLSKQSSNAGRQQSPFVSYPLFQSRYAFNDKDDDKENQGLGFRVNVEAHSKEIFDAGEDMGHMAVDGPVHIKQEFNEAKPLSRYKRKSSDDDDDTPIISKRIKKIDDNGARMEEFPFYGEAEWPLSRDDLRVENSRPRVSLPPRNISRERERQIPSWMRLAQAVNDARSQLKGDDLELFERLIARPRSAVESLDMIQNWKNGELKPRSWMERADGTCPF